jgi:hypothetical protein
MSEATQSQQKQNGTARTDLKRTPPNGRRCHAVANKNTMDSTQGISSTKAQGNKITEGRRQIEWGFGYVSPRIRYEINKQWIDRYLIEVGVGVESESTAKCWNKLEDDEPI